MSARRRRTSLSRLEFALADARTMPCEACEGTGHLYEPRRVGQAVRTSRKARGITGVAFAKGMGIAESFLNRLETGQRAWSPKLVTAALRVFRRADGGQPVRMEEA